MNRRTFFHRCLAGAVLGLARNLPMPAVGKVSGVVVVPDADVDIYPRGSMAGLDESLTMTEVERRRECECNR